MAKVCSNCGTPIQDGVKFCGKCGQKVPVETSKPKVCSNCGTPIQDGVKFCGKCGQKIQVKQTSEPQQRQDSAPQQRQDSAPPQRQDSASQQRQDSASQQRQDSASQQRQDSASQQRQDSAPQQRQDSASQQRQDTAPPQQNQISADEAKENIKNFFSGGFQGAVEKFSALSLKNKAICVAVVVIALSMLFGGNSKTNKPEVQGKYLGMTAQGFAETYNSVIGKGNLQIVNTEINGNDCIYTLKASECRMGGMVQNGELVTVMVKVGKSSADFPLITMACIIVMDTLKNVDGKSVMEQIGQGRTVIENNGVRFIVVEENSESTFFVGSANYNPK